MFTDLVRIWLASHGAVLPVSQETRPVDGRVDTLLSNIVTEKVKEYGGPVAFGIHMALKPLTDSAINTLCGPPTLRRVGIPEVLQTQVSQTLEVGCQSLGLATVPKPPKRVRSVKGKETKVSC